MKQQYLTLQPLGWEAIVLLDESNNNLILFKRNEDQEWYQGMYRYVNKKLISDTMEYKWVLETNRYLILSTLFAMIQEELICGIMLSTKGFEQKRIPEENVKQYSIRYANRYDNYFQNQDSLDE